MAIVSTGNSCNLVSTSGMGRNELKDERLEIKEDQPNENSADLSFWRFDALRSDGHTHLRVFYVILVQSEKHEVRVRCGTGSPFTIFLTIRITVLGEVRPSSEHLLCQIPVALCPRAPAVLQTLEHEPEVR